MKLLFIVGVLTIAQAKPSPKADVGLGYSYKPPSTNYGTPSKIISHDSQVIQSASTASPPVVSSSSPYSASFPGSISDTPQGIAYVTSTQSPISFSTTPATNFQIPIREFTALTDGIQSIANIPLQTGIFPSSLQSNSLPANIQVQSGVPNIYQKADTFNFQNIGNYPIGLHSVEINPFEIQNEYTPGDIGKLSVSPERDAQIEVSKHLYFYTSPEDIEAPQQRINLPKAPVKQNVKILFIKAPSLVTPPPITIPAQKQNEEKTVVYVLVKKPEEPAPIEVDTPPPTPPSKPEVYFIKYKTQKEAEEAIENIQNKQKENNFDQVTQRVNYNTLRVQPNFAVPTPNNQILNGFGNGYGINGISISNKGALGLEQQFPDSSTTIRPLDLNSFSPSSLPVGRLLGSSGDTGSAPGLLRYGYTTSDSNPRNLNSHNSVLVTYPISNNADITTRIDADNINKKSNEILISSDNVSNPTSNSDDEINQSDSISNNGKALIESFGGSITSSPEETSTVSASTIAPSGIFSNAVPHSTYGIPNKRGIRKLARNLYT